MNIGLSFPTAHPQHPTKPKTDHAPPSHPPPSIPPLPIVISQEELSDSPKLSHLLHRLSEHCINDEGVNYSMAHELHEQEQHLFQAKQTYLQSALVMDTVREMIDQKHVIRHKKQRIALARLEKIIQTAQVHRILQRFNPPSVDHESSSSSSNSFMTTTNHNNSSAVVAATTTTTTGMEVDYSVDLLDISPSWLNEVNQMDAILNGMESVVRKYIAPELERRLRAKWESINQFMAEPRHHEHQMVKNRTRVVKSGGGDDDHVMVDDSPQHENIVLSNSEKLINYKLTLREQKTLLRKQILKHQQDHFYYYKKVWQGLVVMNELIQKFKLDYFASFDKLTLEWLSTRVKTMHKKALVMKYQYLVATYNSETIASLRNTRNSLDHELEEQRKRYRLIEYELAEYAKVGEGFDQLVEEYVSVLKKIEEKRWQVQQLQLHGQLQEEEQRVTRQQLLGQVAGGDGVQYAMEQNNDPIILSHQQRQFLRSYVTVEPSHPPPSRQSERGRADFSSSYDQQLRDLFADDDE